MGLSVWTLRVMALRGAIRTVKIGTKPGQRGGRRLVPESEIHAWVASHLRAE